MTPTPGLLALGGLAAVLTLIILGELITSPVDLADTQSEPAKSGDPAHAPAATAVTPQAARPDLTAALLARPLFNPSRRPDNTQVTPTKVGDTPDGDLPRLTGILVSGEQRMAIFEAGGDEKPLVVAEGDDVHGWTVQKIEAASVTVEGPDGTQTLEPKFDPNAATPADPATPPAEPAEPQSGPPQIRQPQNAIPPGRIPHPPRGRMPQRPGRQPGVLPPIPPNLRRLPPRPGGQN